MRSSKRRDKQGCRTERNGFSLSPNAIIYLNLFGKEIRGAEHYRLVGVAGSTLREEKWMPVLIESEMLAK